MSILYSGAVVNFFLVILGSLTGVFLKKGIPERVRTTVMHGMALCVLFIGIKGLFEDGINILVIIISTGLGAIIGELIDIDKWVNRLGNAIENKIKRKDDSRIAEGFVSATLLFCVGAMTVVGSIKSGISNDNVTLYSKSLIDCISAVVLASSLGVGVLFSCFPVLLIEGALTLLASTLEPVLTAEIIATMSVIGSMLIIAIALNMLNVVKIKVMNIIPAVFIPLILCRFIH